MSNSIKYSSTRGGEASLSYEDVLLSGLARDGGLFMPEEWPEFSHSDLNEMKQLNYAELSAKILRPFVEPFLSENELLNISKDTYSVFNKDVAPLYQLNKNLHVLELFHGPTLAFKAVSYTHLTLPTTPYV